MQVRVSNVRQQPLGGVTVACVCEPDGDAGAVTGADGTAAILTGCPDQETHDLGTVAAMTDAQGNASVGGMGTEYPDSCAITVAKPGFRSYRSSFDELCHGDTGHCDRVQHVDVVLEPAPPN